jgi:hypothetical protein
VAIVNRERAIRGREPIALRPIDRRRHGREAELADHFIVARRVIRTLFVHNGFEASAFT